jgi:hypothetical protein
VPSDSICLIDHNSQPVGISATTNDLFIARYDQIMIYLCPSLSDRTIAEGLELEDECEINLEEGTEDQGKITMLFCLSN